MTLLEAFRGLGLRTGDPERDRRREEAARIVLEILRRIGRDGGPLASFPAALREEAIGELMRRMVERRSQGRRAGDPNSDAEVQGHLVRCLRNMAVDLWRKTRHEVAEGAATDRGAAPGPDDAERQVEIHVEAARQLLFTVIGPAVADAKASHHPGAAVRFRETLAMLEALDLGSNVPQVLDFPSDTDGSNPEFARARDAFYRRRFRALRDLHQSIEARHQAGEMEEVPYLACKVVLAALRGKAS